MYYSSVVQIVHSVKDILKYGFSLFFGRCRCQEIPQICPVDVFHDNGRSSRSPLFEAYCDDNARVVEVAGKFVFPAEDIQSHGIRNYRCLEYHIFGAFPCLEDPEHLAFAYCPENLDSTTCR